jgi:alpha-glucosidase
MGKSISLLTAYLFCTVLLCFGISPAQAADHELRSPDGQILIKVSTGAAIQWSVQYKTETILFPTAIALTLNGKPFPAHKTKLMVQLPSAHQDTIFSIVPVKNARIPDIYKELKLVFAGGITLCFRAYNHGVAYRFELNTKDPVLKIDAEEVGFNLNADNQAWWPEEKNPEFISHYEALFTPTRLKDIQAGRYAYLPLYQATLGGTKLVISESDLYDYPNLFLFANGEGKLEGKFPPAVLKSHVAPGTDRREVLAEKAPYIADTKGKRNLPWRLIMIAPDDVTLLGNELVYQLASPVDNADYSWVKPGKVAWDWYNANNLFGVNFQSGINNDTYKYYIDFAARFGLEYVILDEGWSRTTTDVSASRASIDVPALVQYGAAKGVGIILWTLWRPLDEKTDSLLNRFVEWGVKGIKVDFIQRADQYTVNYYEKIAKACADRKLLVDFHGAYKPTGLHRKYPNVINYEGVKGLENNKWADYITPEHNVTLPFTRMMAGPMDYTPGAMRNSNQKDFRVSFNEPVSRGTRAHQAAMYVMYEAPLQMLAETPSLYLQDTAFTRFIARIPTTWQTTIPLAGKIGAYAAIARQQGRQWYISAMTNWEERTLEAKLDFLPAGNYKIEILTDGVNVAKYASDYSITTQQVKKGDVLNMKMAAGGGWTAIITPL